MGFGTLEGSSVKQLEQKNRCCRNRSWSTVNIRSDMNRGDRRGSFLTPSGGNI
jgi:hypothetical protein